MNTLFTFNLLTLFFLNLGLFIIILIADFLRKKIYFKSTYEELKNSYDLFLKYIDRYYISNWKYTIIASFTYITGTIFLFLIIRYLFLGQVITLMRIDNSIVNINYWDFITIIFKYLLCLLSIYLYKISLQILFFKEIVKLRIYFDKFYTKWAIHFYCVYNYLEDICNVIWVLSYRIAMQTFNDDLLKGEYNDFKDKIIIDTEYNYYFIYNNNYINKCIKYLMNISSKYAIVRIFFYYNAKLFKFISRHSGTPGLFKFIPYMFLILSLLYDLYNKELYFIYYSSFFYFIYYIILIFYNFENNLDFIFVRDLREYFYENDFPYSVQRIYIINSENYSAFKKSRQNYNIQSIFESAKEDYDKSGYESGQIFSVLNNITYKVTSDREFKRKFNFLYLRATIILGCIIINTFLFNKLNITINIFNIEISNAIIFCPSLLMIIFAMNTFYHIIECEFTKDEIYSSERIYNVKYSILFWITVSLQSYFYWLLILKPELMFMTTEVLMELPYNIFKVIKIYSQEEKIQYLFQYFEFYSKIIPGENRDKVDIDILRFVIRQIDFITIIDNLNLKDIQVYIKLLIERYYSDNVEFIPTLIQEMLKVIEEIYKIEERGKNIQMYMDPIIKQINILVLGKVIIHLTRKLSNTRPSILLNPTILNNFVKILWKIIEKFKK